MKVNRAVSMSMYFISKSKDGNATDKGVERK